MGLREFGSPVPGTRGAGGVRVVGGLKGGLAARVGGVEFVKPRGVRGGLAGGREAPGQCRAGYESYREARDPPLHSGPRPPITPPRRRRRRRRLPA